MPKQLKEPKNPIRCPFCPLILGVQGLMTHCKNHHPVEFETKTFDYYDYTKNAVKQKDINHPLRLEWREKNITKS